MRSLSKRVIRWILSLIVAVLSVVILYGFIIEPDQVGVSHVWIQDGYLGKVLKDKVVVQLSDLHISKIGRREQKVLSLVRELQPDIIFQTGDYVAWNGNYAPAMTFLSLLQANIGIWAVMGDYDYSSSRKSCIFCHEEGSGKPTQRYAVRFLRDSEDVIDLPEGPLRIAGIDGEGGRPFALRKTFISKKRKLPSIILSHSPLSFELLQDDQPVLMLAGDTHGGQIPLPIPAWIMKLSGYGKNARYNQGFYQQGRKKMFVSRGIGTSHLPFRLFRPPEVVVLHFIPLDH